MASKWMNRLDKLDNVMKIGNYDPDAHVLQTPSPSLNWAFGNAGHGLPLGYSMLLGGPAKAGKSFIFLNMVAQMHRDDPEAIAIMFNTEYRGEVQANEKTLAFLGIDKDRFRVIESNTPDGIFDVISKDINEMCQEGAPIKLIGIDSISMIQGRRAMNADTIMTQQIGDQAATLQAGYLQILPVIRKNKISMVLLTHVRDEMDMAEQMRGNKFKLQGANATKHFAEYFCMVERNKSKTGKIALDGQEFVDESKADAMGKGDVTGHKIRFKVLDSSTGTRDRTGEFTLDFKHGIINKHEEIFTLGLNTGVIQKPNQQTYGYKDRKWRGIADILTALKEEPILQKEILDDVFKLDVKQ